MRIYRTYWVKVYKQRKIQYHIYYITKRKNLQEKNLTEMLHQKGSLAIHNTEIIQTLLHYILCGKTRIS